MEEEEKPLLHIQTGGKLLGQGVYGCIFQPPLLCKGKGAAAAAAKRAGPRQQQKLGKITQKEDIVSEIQAAKILGDTPLYKKYMILPEIKSLCTPKPVEQQVEKDIGKCEAIGKFGYDDMLHYEVEYGGKTLYSYTSTKLEAAQPVIGAFSFTKFMLHLLEGGTYLLLHGYIHNDLHSDNILLNANYTPRFIDFGRSYSSTKIGQTLLDELAAKYMPELSQIPPEYSAQDGLEEGLRASTIFQDLYNQKSGLLYAERYLGQSRKRQMAEFKEFWMTSRAVQKGDWVQFWKLYWPVVDSWSLGNILIGILRKLLLSKQFTESAEWKKGQAKIKAVLRGLLQASPRKRLDCLEALALYDPMNDFVTGDAGQGWLGKKQLQREKTK